MDKEVQYVLKLEIIVGGKKVDEIILKELSSCDFAEMIKECKSVKEIVDSLPLFMDEKNKSIEDSIYFGPILKSNI